MKNLLRLSGAVFAAALLSVGCSGRVPMAPKSGRAPNFEVTTNHLDLGGAVYLYVDLDNDVEKGAALVNELVAGYDGFPDSVKERFDAVKLAKLLGLSQLDAFGLSSYKWGDGYVNKTAVRISGERQGLLRVTGGAPRPFEVLQLAPVDADLVFEQDIYLQQVVQTVRALLESVGEEDALDQLDEVLKQPVAPGLFTWKDLLGTMDTRVEGVLRVHEKELLALPDTSVEMPFTELLLAFDGAGPLLESVAEFAETLPIFQVTTDSRWQTVELTEEIPGAFGRYHPALRRDLVNERLYLVTSLDFFNDCQNAKGAIKGNKAYAIAAAHVDTQSGNALVFVDPGMFSFIEGVARSAADGKDRAMVETVLQIVREQFEMGQLTVSRNTPDGIVQKGYGPLSHKATLMGLGYLNPLTLGVMAAVAVPAFKRYTAGADGAASLSPVEEGAVIDDETGERIEQSFEEEMKRQNGEAIKEQSHGFVTK